jgi:hypothetical protein
MTAEASNRFGAREAGPMSLEKTLAWKANRQRVGQLDGMVETLESAYAITGSKISHLWRLARAIFC